MLMCGATGLSQRRACMITGLSLAASRQHSSLDNQTPAEFAVGWRNEKYEEKSTNITN